MITSAIGWPFTASPRLQVQPKHNSQTSKKEQGVSALQQHGGMLESRWNSMKCMNVRPVVLVLPALASWPRTAEHTSTRKSTNVMSCHALRGWQGMTCKLWRCRCRCQLTLRSPVAVVAAAAAAAFLAADMCAAGAVTRVVVAVVAAVCRR